MKDMINRAENLNSLLEEKKLNFEVVYDQVFKNDGLKDAYILKIKGVNCAPVIYIDNELWIKEDSELVELFENIVKENTYNIDLAKYVNRERIKDTVLPRLVSNKNVPALQKDGIAFINYLDMTVIFYIPIKEPALDNTDGTMQITVNIMNKVSITIKDLFFYAIQNMEKEISIKDLWQATEELCGLPVKKEVDYSVWVVSNTKYKFGAAAILVPKVLYRLQELIGEKFAILPSSIHECIAVPYTDKADLIKYIIMVCTVNAEEVDPEDKLTDNVYYWDGKRLEQFI